MIIIDDILVSDEIIEAKFICHLEKCKGGCCVDGDAGAPLAKNELKKIKEAYNLVKPEMSKAAIKEVEKNGTHTTEEGFGYVTPVIDGGICVYGYFDEKGIVKCLIEKAYNEGKTNFKKPISCHLFPIREIKHSNYIALNYEPRETLCAPACKLGEKEGIKVYEFLKDPLIRKYGEGFYNALDSIAKDNYKKE
jgi:hypothetical protein